MPLVPPQSTVLSISSFSTEESFSDVAFSAKALKSWYLVSLSLLCEPKFLARKPTVCHTYIYVCACVCVMLLNRGMGVLNTNRKPVIPVLRIQRSIPLSKSVLQYLVYHIKNPAYLEQRS